MTAPRMRAGTTDRQAAVDRLTTHFADGRLDAAEFDQRVATAYAATYLDELEPLFADLPSARPERPAWASGPTRPPGPGGWDAHPAGRWGPPGRRPGGPPPAVRLAMFALLTMLVFWSVGALAHGFFPFPLIWLAIILLLVGRANHRRRWRHQHHHH